MLGAVKMRQIFSRWQVREARGSGKDLKNNSETHALPQGLDQANVHRNYITIFFEKNEQAFEITDNCTRQGVIK